MIRRKHLDEEDNPERWLISYADFITLLFAFFVVMYAISSLNLSKYKQLSQAVGVAFTGKKTTVTANIIKQDSSQEASSKFSILKPLPLSYLYQEKYRREHEKMRIMGQELSNLLAPLQDEKKLTVTQNQRGIKLDIQDTLLFESGSAILTDEARPIIEKISESIKVHEHLIQIEGHTDSTPIQNVQYASNWELSAQRATAVLRMMIGDGIEPKRLSAIALADTQPNSDGDSSIAQSSNRRVSIWITPDTLTDNPIKQTIKTEEITPNL